MSHLKDEMRKAKEFYAKQEKPAKPQKEVNRSFHWGMVVFDAFLALMLGATLIGLPFAILFAVSAIRRYEKHLK